MSGAFIDPFARGVMWTPVEARHRKVTPKSLLPVYRRPGAHRRAKHNGRRPAATSAAIQAAM